SIQQCDEIRAVSIQRQLRAVIVETTVRGPRCQTDGGAGAGERIEIKSKVQGAHGVRGAVIEGGSECGVNSSVCGVSVTERVIPGAGGTAVHHVEGSTGAAKAGAR